jgi:nucleoside-diphosphate-sugar epimerase
MARVLVTGACGGIGSKLVPRLLLQGYDVIAIDNLYSGTWEAVADHKNLKKLTLDISDPSEMRIILKDIEFDSCIHLAAISSLPECQMQPERAMEVNFLATVLLSEICASQDNFKLFIFASTSAVYEGIKSVSLSEQMIVSPVLVYPQSKYFSEVYLHSLHATRDFPIVNARLFNVFGENQNTLRKSPPLINYLVRELILGKSPRLFGWNAPARDYISVEHVVTYFIELLVTPEAIGKTLNICSGSGLNVQDIYQIVASAMESDIEPIIDIPERLWSEYELLHQGAFPLSPKIIESETNKISLGSPAAIQSLLGESIKFDIVMEISATALKIRDKLLGIRK